MVCCQLPRLRAEPPGQVAGARGVVAGLAFTLGLVPLCGYARVLCLKAVALAGSLPSTERTACLAAVHSITGPRKPAVLLPCWAVSAQPEKPARCKATLLCQEGAHTLHHEGGPTAPRWLSLQDPCTLQMLAA